MNTENVKIVDSSLRVESVVGPGEMLSVEDIEGLLLFSLSGRVAAGSEVDAMPTASTAFERDIWKYDIVEWIQKAAGSGVGLDPQALTDEAFSIIELEDANRAAGAEIADLKLRRRSLVSNTGQRKERKAQASAHFEAAIEQHGVAAIDANPELRAQILQEAMDSDAMVGEEMARTVTELTDQIEQRQTALDRGLGAQLAEFRQSDNTRIKRLIQPIRKLVQLDLLTPGESFEGVLTNAVDFSSYGPSGQKLAVAIPAKLNNVTIPLSYKDALEFADRAHKAAGTKKSIWSGA